MPHRPVLFSELLSGLRLLLSRTALAVALMLPGGATLSAAEPLDGQVIYEAQCAVCHGAKGEGSEFGYSNPLIGDRPLIDLTRVIDETMPEGEPEALSSEEAAAVAAYIYDAFYSEDAQTRNSPPRVELSRLTNRQFENSVTDLVGSFGRPANHGDERGLAAEYYNDRSRRRDKRVIERRDATVDFDFGTSSPDAEKIDAHQFAIGWKGSVFAPETGDYEFIVRSDHATRLWINDSETPLVDAWVKSGDDTEFRGSLHLLGGRAYTLRLDFSKATQGVDSKSKDKELPPAPASISLRWKRPFHAEEAIPTHYLSPVEQPYVFVIDAPFPPDDRSTGFERGTSISKQWDEAATQAALQVAAYVAGNLDRLAETKQDADDRGEKIRKFCTRFVERAFGRPLSDEQRALYVDRQLDEAPDLTAGVKRVVLLSLKSPRFLYREAATPEHDAYDVASRLALGLWDSLPDQKLLDAAAQGKLTTPGQIRDQAKRMIDDARTESKLRAFMHQWLGLDRLNDIAKDASLYPEFDKKIESDLRTSLELFIDEVIADESADFRRLLLDDSIYANGRIAKFYGIELPDDAPFQRVTFEPEARSGVLTHPYLLAGLAYFAETSPIHRGVFVSRGVLGRTLMPPPEAVSPLAPDLHPDLSTRDRVALQTSAASCQSCHAMINPLGFTLEQFDAVGRFRKEERDRPVDPSGFYLTQSGETIEFDDAGDLARFLAGADEAHEAFIERLFSYTAKQPVQAFGPDRLTELRQSFAGHKFEIRHLLTEIATTAAIGESGPAEVK